jgi:hypothetical protein
LLLGLIVSGLLLARVPLNAFTGQQVDEQSEVVATEKPATKAHAKQTADATDLTSEQSTAVVETPAEQAVETAAAPAIAFELSSIKLSTAQDLLQQNKGLFGQVLAALPSAADLIPRTSSTTPTEESTTEAPTQIVLRNPSDSGGGIRFLMGTQLHELQPGDELHFTPGEALHLRFHRGEAFGNAEHMLQAAGLYEFVPTQQGWVLSTEH